MTKYDFKFSNTNVSVELSINSVIPLSKSSHDCIFCVSKVNYKQTPPQEITCGNYKNYDSIAFSNNFKGLN